MPPAARPATVKSVGDDPVRMLKNRGRSQAASLPAQGPSSEPTRSRLIFSSCALHPPQRLAAGPALGGTADSDLSSAQSVHALVGRGRSAAGRPVAGAPSQHLATPRRAQTPTRHPLAGFFPRLPLRHPLVCRILLLD